MLNPETSRSLGLALEEASAAFRAVADTVEMLAKAIVPASAQPAHEPAQDKTETTPDVSSAMDYETVKTAVLDLVKAKGNAAAKKLLGEFGAARATDVPEAEWPKLIEAVQKAMAA